MLRTLPRQAFLRRIETFTHRGFLVSCASRSVQGGRRSNYNVPLPNNALKALTPHSINSTTVQSFSLRHTTRAFSTTKSSNLTLQFGGRYPPQPFYRRQLPRFFFTIVVIGTSIVLVYNHLTTPPPPLLHPRKFTPFILISRAPASRKSQGASCESAIFTFRADKASAEEFWDGWFALPAGWVGRGWLASRIKSGGLGEDRMEREGEGEMDTGVRDLMEMDGDGGWSKFWKKGLWSVEVKQPFLQIARRYTPLPPIPLDNENENNSSGAILPGEVRPEKNDLRLLIKLEPGGEVSRWLFDLDIGTTIWFRGPRWEWIYPEWIKRLSNIERDAQNLNKEEKKKSIVFLAGGTGIAPALQLAAAMIPGKNRENMETSNSESLPLANLAILWAVRKPGDITPQIKRDIDTLHRLSSTRGRVRLNIEYHIDSLETYITKEDIALALGIDSTLITQSTAREGSRSWFSLGGSGGANVDDSTTTATSGNGDIPRPTTPAIEEQDRTILISGPDGFIRHFTGAKSEDGSQGRLGGVIRGIIAAAIRNSSGGGKDVSVEKEEEQEGGRKRRRGWFVWKL